MRKSAYVVGAVLIALLAAGCAGQDAAADRAAPADPAGNSAGGSAVDTDPTALIGMWSVTAAEGEEKGSVLRIAPEGMSLWRDCGTLMGNWRADTAGLFVADMYGSTGCAPETPMPGWLRAAVAYQIEGDERVLLDDQGKPVARLLPGGKPAPNPNVAPEEAQPPVVTDEARRSLARAAALPAGLSAAERGALVGRWVPEGSRGLGAKRAYVELRADGDWKGSDGCNGLGGRWGAGQDGSLLATSGVSTLIACDNAPIGEWLSAARRAGLDGETLVLVDAEGKELGRLRPDR